MTVADIVARLRAGPVDARTAIQIAVLLDLPQDARVQRLDATDPGLIVAELTLTPDEPFDASDVLAAAAAFRRRYGYALIANDNAP